MQEKTIGIVGGMGPRAGIDLVNLIMNNTISKCDHDHLSVVVVSRPSIVCDRTDYLLGNCVDNPSSVIINIIKELVLCDVNVVGIPCNTSHSPEIFNNIISWKKTFAHDLIILNMVESVVNQFTEFANCNKSIGLLVTEGTKKSKVYDKCFEKLNLNVAYPDDNIQQNYLNRAIYHPVWGIKSISNPVSSIARKLIYCAMDNLLSKDVEHIILGCTELPLAINTETYKSAVIYNSSEILARELIKVVAPQKLKNNN